MKTLVLSDVHLDAAKEGQERMGRFVAFLRQIDPSEVQRIIILGDLFDFWFEYKHVVFSGYFDVLRAFAALSDQGVRFDFVCGNHDLWAGRFLRDHLGFAVYPDRLETGVAGKRVLLVHGDGINEQDVSYRVYKRVVRARPIVWLFGLLHPDWAMAIARRVSNTNQRILQPPEVADGPEVQPLQEFARDVLARGEADVVMSGHSHHPVCEEYPGPDGTGLYINTGDWLGHRSYVECDGEGFRLREFEEISEEVAGSEAQPAVEDPEHQP